MPPLIAVVAPLLYVSRAQGKWSRRSEVRPLLIAAGAAALSIALWAGLGETEAAPFLVGALTNAGAPVNVSYYRRHRSYYAYKDSRSQSCAGDGYAEVRELQTYWPQTLWPPSMRCFPYR